MSPLRTQEALQEHYSILEVSVDATQAQIRSSYRELALEWHPDKNGGDEVAAEYFKKIAAAYEILGDPDKRYIYDTDIYNSPRDYGIIPKDRHRPRAPPKATKKEERQAKKAQKKTFKKNFKQAPTDEEFWTRSAKTFDIKDYMYTAKGKTEAGAKHPNNKFQPKQKQGPKWATVTVSWSIAGDEEIEDVEEEASTEPENEEQNNCQELCPRNTSNGLQKYEEYRTFSAAKATKNKIIITYQFGVPVREMIYGSSSFFPETDEALSLGPGGILSLDPRDFIISCAGRSKDFMTAHLFQAKASRARDIEAFNNGTWTNAFDAQSSFQDKVNDFLDTRKHQKQQRLLEQAKTMRTIEAPDFTGAVMRVKKMGEQKTFNESMNYTRYRGLEMNFEPLDEGAEALDTDAIQHLLIEGPFGKEMGIKGKDFSDGRTSKFKKMIKHSQRTAGVLEACKGRINDRALLMEQKSEKIKTLIKSSATGTEVVKAGKLKVHLAKGELRQLVKAQKKDCMLKQDLAAKEWGLQRQSRKEIAGAPQVETEQQAQVRLAEEKWAKRRNEAREEWAFFVEEVARREMGRCTLSG